MALTPHPPHAPRVGVHAAADLGTRAPDRHDRLQKMLRSAPALIDDVRTLARQLEEEPRAQAVARRLASTYRTLRVTAGELGLVHVSRVARGGEVFAQLVSTDAISAVPRHFLMLAEIRLGLSRLVDRVRERGSDATCSREASHVMNVVLSSEPIVGALLLQRSVLATAELA